MLVPDKAITCLRPLADRRRSEQSAFHSPRRTMIIIREVLGEGSMTTRRLSGCACCNTMARLTAASVSRRDLLAGGLAALAFGASSLAAPALAQSRQGEARRID